MSAPNSARFSGTARADRALSRYVGRTVYPYSSHYRAALDRAGLGRRGVRSRADLRRLPPTELAELGDRAAFMLQPDPAAIRRLGGRSLAARLVIAQALGTVRRFNRRVIEPRFKPVVWLPGPGAPVGWSIEDFDRLAGLGARWLERAGVGGSDVLVSLLPFTTSVAQWALEYGARQRRVASTQLGPQGVEATAELGPSAVAGHPAPLEALLAGGASLPNLTTVLCVFEAGRVPDLGVVGRLRSLAGRAAVIAAWSPPAVRSVWTECRPAALTSTTTASALPALHTWPGAEVVEVAADAWEPPGEGAAGELLWTGLGWTGSAALRLRTAQRAVLDPHPCPHCHQPGPLLRPVPPSGPETTPSAAREILDRPRA